MRRLTVLAVGTNEAYLEALEGFLRTDPLVYSFEQVRPGREALDRVRLRWPDVVLADLLLPIETGVNAIRALKALEPAPAVVVLTAYAQEDYRRAASAAGADGFVDDNCIVAELLPLLHRLFETEGVSPVGTTAPRSEAE